MTEAGERLLAHVTMAQRQVHKLSALVGALLDVGLLAEGAHLPLQREEGVDLVGVVRDVRIQLQSCLHAGVT